MDHSNHTRLRPDEFRTDIVEGATVYGPDDAGIGTASHLHGTGPTAQAVIDVGGFLGIGAKPVAIGAADLDFMRDERGTVHAITSMTRETLKSLPEHHD